jgi:hypothetical protein
MPSSDQPAPRHRDAGAEYSYRRPLGLRELLPAIGIAVGAGLFAFYVTRLLLQRTPLRVGRRAEVLGLAGGVPGTRQPRSREGARADSLERSARS